MTGWAEFSVYQFFHDDSYELVLDRTGAETAVLMAQRLSQSVGGRAGMISRIIITDGTDGTVFEWIYGEGITYPTEEMRRQASVLH